MVTINISMPASCANCKFKGSRLCYIAVWLEIEHREVPKEGRADWCPLIDMDRQEDDGK